MKKLLITSLTAIALIAATTPTQAGNPWPVIGGIAGGLLLGEVLLHNHHDHGPRPGYDERYYEEDSMCWIEVRRVWDHHLHRYFVEKVRYCD